MTQLAFDFDRVPLVPVHVRPAARRTDRQLRGERGYHDGLAAEHRVAQDYERRGYPILHHRWRGKGGEIDLIARDGDGLVFIEVKKSRSFDRAIQHLTPRQARRLQGAAEEFLGTQPRGSLTDLRFDVVLLNEWGEMRVIESVLFY